ncbi:MAG: hypothetical protein CMJ76_07735 [Planctomycetaceae bacterium]|nr:hypothetical protein [Planctomycetaceae bacterium]
MSGYMDGQLSAEEHALAEAALQSDVTAAKVLADLQILRSGMRALSKPPLDSSAIPSLADQVLSHLDTAPIKADTEVVPASLQSKLTDSKSASGNHWTFYISILSVLIAVFAVWQVIQIQQDNEGNSIANLDQNLETLTDDNSPEGSRVEPDDKVQENDSTNLVIDESGKNPRNQDVEESSSEMPEEPKPNELVTIPEVPQGNDLAGQPDLSVLTNGKFLFVIEVGVTPQGVEADVIRDVLMKNGIIYDGGLDVMPELETQLLQSRFLNGVVKNEEQPVGGTVDLIYMVASGLQIDQTRLDIHRRHDHIARYRFNMALLPKDVGVFDNLHRTVKSQWASDEPSPDVNDKAVYREQLKQWKGKASQLMTTLYFLAGKGAAVSKVGIDIPTTPNVPKGANRGTLKEPDPTEKPILGADLICEVLLVVRNMTPLEVERLPDVEENK